MDAERIGAGNKVKGDRMSELSKELLEMLSNLDSIERHYKTIISRLSALEMTRMCDRCTSGFDAHQATLGNNYHCVICNNCQNEWHEFIREKWEGCRVSNSMLSATINNGDTTGIESYLSILHKKDREVFEAARNFVNNSARR